MSTALTQARKVLFVDDETMTTKWFEKAFRNEFAVVSVSSVSEALLLLSQADHGIAVVVTDFRMPERSGLDLLKILADSHPFIIKILASAYADKDMMIQAVNQQLVFRVLEKPWDDAAVRRALHAALSAYAQGVKQWDALGAGNSGMRESLGFLGHELNSPLSIIGTYLGMIMEQIDAADLSESRESLAKLKETLPVMQGAQRNIKFCLNLVRSFTQSSKQAFVNQSSQPIQSSHLVRLMLHDFPFQEQERQQITLQVQQDFTLIAQQNLIYLCLTTIVQNALRALQNHAMPSIVISTGTGQATRPDNHWISVEDNGPGIANNVYERLLVSPMTTYEANGSTGMGLLFCKKVMTALGGNITIETRHADRGFSAAQSGTRVTLHFPSH